MRRDRRHAESVSAGQRQCGRDRIRTCEGNAGDFTGRTGVSSRVPTHPHLAPPIAGDVHKRPVNGFRRSLGVPARCATCRAAWRRAEGRWREIPAAVRPGFRTYPPAAWSHPDRRFGRVRQTRYSAAYPVRALWERARRPSIDSRGVRHHESANNDHGRWDVDDGCWQQNPSRLPAALQQARLHTPRRAVSSSAGELGNRFAYPTGAGHHDRGQRAAQQSGRLRGGLHGRVWVPHLALVLYGRIVTPGRA
jgi:hypothetical protein